MSLDAEFVAFVLDIYREPKNFATLTALRAALASLSPLSLAFLCRSMLVCCESAHVLPPSQVRYETREALLGDGLALRPGGPYSAGDFVVARLSQQALLGLHTC